MKSQDVYGIYNIWEKGDIFYAAATIILTLSYRGVLRRFSIMETYLIL